MKVTMKCLDCGEMGDQPLDAPVCAKCGNRNRLRFWVQLPMDFAR